MLELDEIKLCLVLSTGPKRYTKPPCHVKDLPTIHAVVISHNHYDHLDVSTVRQLHGRFNDELRWFVPLGLKSWFNDMSVKNVTGKIWFNDVLVQTS